MTCRLCLQNKKLVDSHIIPEFLYKSLYDNLHRFEILSGSKEEKHKYKQKGIREKLLCFECEQYLSKLEDYAKRILYGKSILRLSEDRGKYTIKGIDYSNFKLFQMSILWRASVSKNHFYSKVKLGPHEEKLRKMLLAKNPGEPYEYGCLMIIVLMKNGKIMDEIMRSPEFWRIDGHRLYRFVFGGCQWDFVVSNHSRNYKNKEFFLSKNGNLTIFPKAAEKTWFFNKAKRNIQRSKQS